MEDHVLRNVQIFCESIIDASPGEAELETQWQPAQEIGQLADWLIMDIIGGIGFGKSFEMLTSDHNRWFLDVLPNGIHLLNIVKLLKSAPLLTLGQKR